MKLIAYILSTTCLLAFGTQTFAAKQGFYLGGQVGYAGVKKGNPAISSNKAAGGIYGGYNYQVAKPLLVGIDYEMNYLGRVILPHLTDDIYSNSISARLTYLISPKFNLFAKAGINKQEASHRTTSGTGNSAFVSSAGVGYNWTDSWETTISFQHIAGSKVIDDNGGEALTYNNIFLSLQYNF